LLKVIKNIQIYGNDTGNIAEICKKDKIVKKCAFFSVIYCGKLLRKYENNYIKIVLQMEKNGVTMT
jgi:hypothetical protein